MSPCWRRFQLEQRTVRGDLVHTGGFESGALKSPDLPTRFLRQPIPSVTRKASRHPPWIIHVPQWKPPFPSRPCSLQGAGHISPALDPFAASAAANRAPSEPAATGPSAQAASREKAREAEESWGPENKTGLVSHLLGKRVPTAPAGYRHALGRC